MYIRSCALIAAHEFTGSDNSAMCINPAVLCEYDRSDAVSEVQAIQSYLPRRDVSTEPSLQTGYQSVSTHHQLLCRVRAENWLSHKIIYNWKVLRFCCSVVTYFSLNCNHPQNTCNLFWILISVQDQVQCLDSGIYLWFLTLWMADSVLYSSCRLPSL